MALHQQHRQTTLRTEDPLLDETVALNQGDNLYITLGQRLAAEGRTREAIAALNKALELNPGGAVAHAGLVGLYGRLDDFDQAEAHYRQGAAIDPGLFPLHLNFGLIQLRAGLSADVAETFRRAAAINLHDARAHLNLGVALEQTGRRDEAAAAYRLALDNDPGSREAHFFLGQYLAFKQDYRPAIEHLKQSLEPVDAQTPWFLWTLARTYTNVDEVKLAESAFRRARTLAVEAQNPRLAAAIEDDLQAYLSYLESAR